MHMFYNGCYKKIRFCTYSILMQGIGWEFPMKMELLSDLDEFQNQLETLGHFLNVRIFEITSVRIHANVDVA